MTAEKMIDPLEMLLDAARFIGPSKPAWALAARTAVAKARSSAVGAGAREALEPAGKQARFKKDTSPWFGVFDWHNDPENFEYRVVYALQPEPVQPAGKGENVDLDDPVASTIMGAARFHTHDHQTAFRITRDAIAALKAIRALPIPTAGVKHEPT